MTVWKFPFAIDDAVVIAMPEGAELLNVGCQEGQPCIWARVNPEAPYVNRMFHICGTGHPAPSTDHVATFQQGPLVWHLFE